MRTTTIAIAIAIAVAVTPLITGAAAAAKRGVYLELHGGVNFVHTEDMEDYRVNLDWTVDRIRPDPVAEARYQTGYAVGGAIGYRFNRMTRLEVEATYRRNDYDDIDWSVPAVKTGSFATSGEIAALALMNNFFFDIPTGGPVTPILGIGLGYVRVSLDDVADRDGPLFDEEIDGLGFQLGTGVGYAVSDHVTLSLEYRFFAALLLDSVTPRQAALTHDLYMDYGSSNFRLALRYRF